MRDPFIINSSHFQICTTHLDGKQHYCIWQDKIVELSTTSNQFDLYRSIDLVSESTYKIARFSKTGIRIVKEDILTHIYSPTSKSMMKFPALGNWDIMVFEK